MEKKQGFGNGNSEFGRVARLAAIVTFLGFASLSPTKATEPAAPINVRVYNYAKVERRILVDAEKEAARILGQAGIETAWLDCPLDPAEFEERPACQQPLGPTDIVLRFIPSSMMKGLPFDHSKVGFAFLTKEGPRGSLAGVFYSRILTLARGDDYALALGLGRATAHEIGHLLLRSEGHSPRGIMRANWGRRDFRDGTEILSFTPEQSAEMRAEVQERQAQTQASLRDAVSPASELAAKR
jgi:hypothetical protein